MNISADVQGEIKLEELLVGQMFLKDRRGTPTLYSVVDPKSGSCRYAATGVIAAIDPCAMVTLVTLVPGATKPASRCGAQATEVLCAFLQVPHNLRKYVLCELVSNLDA